jgi:hypothetical protein
MMLVLQETGFAPWLTADKVFVVSRLSTVTLVCDHATDCVAMLEELPTSEFDIVVALLHARQDSRLRRHLLRRSLDEPRGEFESRTVGDLAGNDALYSCGLLARPVASDVAAHLANPRQSVLLFARPFQQACIDFQSVAVNSKVPRIDDAFVLSLIDSRAILAVGQLFQEPNGIAALQIVGDASLIERITGGALKLGATPVEPGGLSRVLEQHGY